MNDPDVNAIVANMNQRERGEALEAAVKARPDLTVAALARATGYERQTYYVAIKGEGSTKALSAFEDAVHDFDEHPDDFVRHPESAVVIGETTDGQLEVELGGVVHARFRAEKVIVRGPVGSVDELVDAVQKILEAQEPDAE